MSFLDQSLGLFWYLIDEDDGGAHLEAASHLTLLKLSRLVRSRHLLTSLSRMERSVEVKRLSLAGLVGLVEVVWVDRHGTVRDNIGVKIEENASDVQSSNERSEEEVTGRLPRAKDVDTLVVLEDVAMLVHVAGLDRLKVPGDMAPVVTLVDSWRVEPVVITRGKVDDHVMKLVAFG